MAEAQQSGEVAVWAVLALHSRGPSATRVRGSLCLGLVLLMRGCRGDCSLAIGPMLHCTDPGWVSPDFTSKVSLQSGLCTSTVSSREALQGPSRLPSSPAFAQAVPCALFRPPSVPLLVHSHYSFLLEASVIIPGCHR